MDRIISFGFALLWFGAVSFGTHLNNSRAEDVGNTASAAPQDSAAASGDFATAIPTEQSPSPLVSAMSASFKILGAPRRVGTGWEISWSSVAGKNYKLQRLAGDAITTGTRQWIDVQPVAATGGTASGIDLAPSNQKRFYRIVQVEPVPDTVPPTVSQITANPANATAEGIVTLSVSATDNAGVSSVQFFDGSTLLGNAARGEGDTWRLFWTLEITQNGAHNLTAKAADAAGNSHSSTPLNYSVAITSSQRKQVTGLVKVNANTLTTNGTAVVATGNVRIGNASLNSGTGVTINSALNQVTGSGTVSLVGIGAVYSGPFAVDTSSGLLTPTLPRQSLEAFASTSFPPIQISSNVTIQATNLTVNILNNALKGSGSVILTLDGQTGGDPVKFDGSFELDYSAFTLGVDGACVYKGIQGGGRATLNLNKKTFSLTNGNLSLAGSGQSLFKITEGTFELTFLAPSLPEFHLSGKLSLPIPLTVAVDGKLDTQGAFSLTGSGSGTVGGFTFDPLEANLARADQSAPITLSFNGSAHLGIGTFSLAGKIGSDGTLSGLNGGAEDLNLGNGVRILAENGQPVLQFLQDTAGVKRFQVSGAFRLPSSVVTAVHVDGTLEVSGDASNLQVRSFSASSSVDLNLSLPGDITVRKARAKLGYTGTQFTGGLGGEVALGADGKIPVDVALILQESDPEDIQIDAQLTPSNITIAGEAQLFSSNIHLQAKTQTSSRPLSGQLTLGGAAGLIKRGTLSAPPAAGDFYLNATNLSATVTFQGANFNVVISAGTLHLPETFSQRTCTGADGGPAVAITASAPLTLVYSDANHSLSLTGGFDFSNLGFAAGSATLELCTARLVFNSSSAWLTNVTGRLVVPAVSGDFRLDSGSLDTRGNFDFTSSGAFTLDSAQITYTALRVVGSPAGLAFSGTGRAVFPNGSVAEVSVLLNGNEFSFVGTQNRIDLGSGLVLVPIEPAAQNPMVKFTRSGNAFTGAVKGRLLMPGNQYIEVAGAVNNTSFQLSSAARVHFGDGVWLTPVANNQPVLVLQGNTSGNMFFAVQGLFQWPGSSGNTEQALVAGSLHLLPGPVVQSFHAETSTPSVSLSLAPSLVLRQTSVTLDYSNNAFRARFTGTSDLASATVNVDAQLILNAADPQDVQIDSALGVQNLNLADQFYLFSSGLRLQAQTPTASRQGFARISASGKAGLFAQHTPLASTPADADFYLLVRNAAAVFELRPEGFSTTLRQGTLALPSLFKTGLCTNGGSGPSVTVTAANPITLTYLASGNSLTFGGALNFQNIGFRLPDYPDIGAELCSATLTFSNSQLPEFTGVSGTLSFPLNGKTNHVDLVNAGWKLNGFPHGTIQLPQDLQVFSQGDFSFSLLGGQSCGANVPATSITIAEAQIVNGVPQLPRLEIHGGVEFQVSKDVVENDTSAPATTDNPDPQQVRGRACGGLILTPDQLPQITLDTVSVTGSFRIGGGLRLKNGSLTLEGLQNIFGQSESHPFIIRLGGTIVVDQGPAFGMNNTRFVFFDNSRLPRVEPGTFTYQQGDWDLPNHLPIVVRSASARFLDGSKSRLEELFNPSNVKLGLSATIAIPSAEDPYFSGSINDLQVTFAQDGTPNISVDGFAITLAPGTSIPPVDEIGGSIYVTGLRDFLQNPSALFFTGRVAGSYQGYKLKFLLAFNMLGPIGMCVDVNAGSVGIPIAQTGFLISGASGGFSFVNSNADPCNFSTYMDDQGRPISNPLQLPPGLPAFPAAKMNWSQLRSYAQRVAQGEIIPVSQLNSDGTADITMQRQTQIPCPGDCPPATVNILCQPHPDAALYPNRVVVKFTSIDENTLNTRLGITEQSIQNLLATSANIAADLAHQLRVSLDGIIPDPDPALGTANVTRLRTLKVQTLDSIESSFRDLLALAIGNNHASSFIYGQLRDLAYAGLPCPDVTFKVSGTGTHVAVSSFLSVTGEGTLSTTGSGGLAGKINLLGVPVGIGKVFVAATDNKGLPNPSICGDIHVTIGPAEIGYLKAALQCQECVSGVLEVFGNVLLKLSRPVIDQIIRTVKPELNLPAAQQDAAALLNSQLTAVEKIAFIAQIFQLSPDQLPGDLDQVILTAQDALGLIIDRINPELLMCGQAKPKLFGIPLGGDFASVQYRMNKFGRDATFSFSPSILLQEVTVGPLFPPSDNASFGYSESFPDFGRAIMAGLTGKLSTPAAAADFAKQQFASMLENSTYTAAYNLSPMGFNLARAAARVINPDLTSHPLIRQPAWVHPELRGEGLLSRPQLLQAVLRAQLLGNALWKGSATDFAQIFPDGSPERALYQSKQITLTHDYFPHGGIVGAGYLDIPRSFYEAVPPEFFKMTDPANPTLQRLQSAYTYVSEYVLKTSEAGTLNFYIPAPNPPAFQQNGQVLGPMDLLDSIIHQDFASIRGTALYPLGEFFLQGDLAGKLLGVDVANAQIVGSLGDGNTEAYFRVTANVTQNAWLQKFVQQASLAFQIRQCPPDSIQNTFAQYAPRLQQLIASGGGDDAAAQALLADLDAAITTKTPKVSLEASLQNFNVPVEMSPYLSGDGSGSATLYAYSPRYSPNAPGSGPVAQAQRNGGLAFKGNFRFANLITVPNAELSVLLHDNSLPEISGQIALASAPLSGLALQNATLSFNTATPFVSVGGRVQPFAIGQIFQVSPITGTDLGAQFDLRPNAFGQPSASVLIDPARLTLGPLLGSSVQLRLQGATPSSPFSYSGDGPFTANVTLESSSPLELKDGANVVLRVPASNISSITLSRDNQNVTQLKVSIANASTIIAFPDQSLQQVITTSSATTLTIASNGTFSLDTSISDQNMGGVTLRGRAQMGNAPSFSFSLGGEVVLPSLGGIAIVPRVAGTPLSGSFTVKRNAGGTFDAGITVKPARVTLSSLLGSDQGFNIDGGSDQQDFTFSNSGPWSGRLTLTGSSPLELRAAGQVLARIAQSSISSASLGRDNSGVLSIAISIPSGGTISVFPDSSYSQTLSLSNAAALVLASDGSFALTAKNQGSVSLSGAPVASVNAGSQFSFTPSGLTLTGGLSGGVLGQVSTIGDVSGSVVISPAGTIGVSGTVSVSPLTLGQFSVAPPGGGNFNASLSSAGLALPSGAVLSYRGSQLLGIGLPSIQISPNGDFSVTSGVGTITLAGFNINSASVTFGRSGAETKATLLGGNLQIPKPDLTLLASVGLTGVLNSDGSFNLSGATSTGIDLMGAPVATLQANTHLVFDQNSLSLTGGLSGGVLAQVTTVGNVTGTVTITAAGNASVLGNVTVSPLILGQFTVAARGGGNFAASLSSAGLSFPSGAILSYRGSQLLGFGLPAIQMSSNGDFSVTSGLGTITLSGFNINSASLTFGRAAGVVTASLQGGSVQIPKPDLTLLASVGLTGVLNSDGSFNLSGATSTGIDLIGAPVATLQSNAHLVFDQNSLSLTGGLSGGVLAQVTAVGNVTGTVTINAAGNASVLGSVTVSPLILGQFTVAAPGGGNFAASLSSAGLSFPSGAILSYRGSQLLSFGLPAIQMSPNGDFSVTPGLGTITLNGFNLNSGSFTFGRSGGITSAQYLSATLNVPKPGGALLVAVKVTGSLASDGNFNLTGATSADLALTGLPISSLQASANVAFSQNGVLIIGGISGGVLKLVNVLNLPRGTLSIAADGTTSISAKFPISPLGFDQFHLDPPSGTSFTVSLSNAGMTIPAAAILSYRGAQFGNVKLPAITMAANGDFQIGVNKASINLLGFNINANYTFQRLGGVASIVNLAGSIAVPGPGITLATVNVGGTLNSDGTFAISGNAGVTVPVPKLIISSLGADASLFFNQNALTLTGTAQGGVMNQVTPAANATAVITVSSAGDLQLSGGITIFPFANGPFHLESLAGGNLTVTFGASGLDFTGARLRVDNLFSTTVPLPSFTLPVNGSLAIPVTPAGMSVAGIPLANISFTLQRSGGLLFVNPITANLALPGFSQRLNTGSISSDGILGMTYNGSLTMGGFTAADGVLQLSNSGLNASGTFDLHYGGTSFGLVGFSGPISLGKSFPAYNLTQTSGGISIGGFSIPSPNLTLNIGYVSGSATLPFGNLSVPLNNLRISAASGLSFDTYNKGVDSNWIKIIDVILTDNGDTSVRLAGTVAFASTSNSFTSTLSYAFGGWVVYTDGCDFRGRNCTTHYPPGDINSSQTVVSGSDSIGSDGKFTINTGFAGRNSFSFGPFW